MIESKQDLIKKIREESIWFCPRLFDHLYIETNGNYKVCCIGCNSNTYIDNSSPSDWLNSDEINSIRLEMLDEESNLTNTKKHCNRCLTQEKRYQYSDRIKHINKVFNDSADSWPVFDQILQYIKTGNLKLERRTLIVQPRIFGNQCNLDCYMCQPQASSTRASQTEKWNYDQYINFDRERIATQIGSSTRIEEIANLGKFIDRIVIQGGEPMIMKKQYPLLDKLIESGDSSDIIIDMNSNCTVLGDSKYNILDYIPKFRRLCLNASLDSVGEYNNYIRRRSKWEQIVKNLKTLQSYPNVVIDVFSTVSLLSILRYTELEKFAKENNWPLQTFIVDDPDELHVRHLPEKLKDTLIKTYAHIPVIKKALKLKGDNYKFKKAINYIKQQDKIYKTNIYEMYPELKEFDEEI